LFLIVQKPLLPPTSDISKKKTTKSKKERKSVTPRAKAAFDQRVQGLVENVALVIPIFKIFPSLKIL